MAEPPPPPPTPPAPKPTQQPAPTPATASAATASTKPDQSPCASAGACTTSASDEPAPGTRVLILIQDLNIRIINATTGELLRELTLDPTTDYQPTSAPKRKIPNLTQVRDYSDVPRHDMVAGTGFETTTTGMSSRSRPPPLRSVS